MGTHTLDDNDFAESTHEETDQAKRFDCVPMGKLGKITTKNCIDFSNKNLLKYRSFLKD